MLVLTTFDLDEVVYDALRAGASGFLLKDAPEDRLTTAIRVVADGGSLFAPSVTRRLIEEFASATTRPRRLARRAHRARDRGAAPGRPRAAATPRSPAELYITENTVKTHVARVLMKLGLRDRVQAVVLAYEIGLDPSRRLTPVDSADGLRPVRRGVRGLLNSPLADGRGPGAPPRRPGLAARQATDRDATVLRKFQRELRPVFEASDAGDIAGVIGGLNELMERHPITPRISDHDADDLHLHVATRPPASPTC